MISATLAPGDAALQHKPNNKRPSRRPSVSPERSREDREDRSVCCGPEVCSVKTSSVGDEAAAAEAARRAPTCYPSHRSV